MVRFLWFGYREEVWSKRIKLSGSSVFIKEDFPLEVDRRRARLFLIWKAARAGNKKVSLVADKLFIEGSKYTVDSLHTLPQAFLPCNLAIRNLDNAVLFYGRDAVFSNFHDSKFTLGDREWNVEQYYQFHKAQYCGDESSAAAIKLADDPFEYRRLGHKIKINDHWNDDVAKQIMQEAVKEKFSQNVHLKKQLLETGSKALIECIKHSRQVLGQWAQFTRQ